MPDRPPSPDAPPLLEAIDLRVPPPPGAARAPLAGPISLSLAPGQALAVRGPSGSGKTTLLRSLALLEPRAEGEVRLEGRRPRRAEVPAFRQRVAYLPQTPPRWEGAVEESLRLPFQFQSQAHGAFEAARALGLLEALGLDAPDLLERPLGNLSQGEAQRVALVRALITSPQILLLDEPTAALDPASRERCEGLLEEWIAARPERALVLVSHDPAQIERLCQRSLTLGSEAA